MPEVKKIIINENISGQRLDNFLLNQLKGVPKSKVYSIIRKGEIRINSKRKKPSYKLAIGDEVRVPPVKGRLIVWPAGFTHVHRGNPPLKETKYAITGWINYVM